jgi:cytochrome c-type biogenesis protein CcsB
MHVSIMLLSYAALLGGSLISITYLVLNLVLERNTEPKSFSLSETSVPEMQGHESGNAIPELLVNLDNFSYRSLAFAFPMLTLGIISGAVWANEAWGSYWSWDPKETWALITWFIFAIYLHVRINKGWVGKKAALVATFGFFMVWVCYLGVNLLGKGLHSYGWWNS